jgi:16S rRNA (uracil1498-N3)-methyltransferase
MMMPLFYFENISADEVILDEEASKHIVQVLRMQNGEKLELTDGKGNIAVVIITDNHKKRCSVKVHSRRKEKQREKKTAIAISLLKNTSRFELFLEKATELGIAEIIPLICERTEKQHFRYERMDGIVISAMIQSRQAWKPLLSEPLKFSDFVRGNHYSQKLIAHCMEGEKSHVKDFIIENSAIILIGPEGDFTKTELEFAKDFTSISLGNNRLRTETAGVVASVFLCA